MSVRLHGDALAAPGLADFAVNVWPAARPPLLERVLCEAVLAPGYPDPRAARAALAARHGRDPGEVLPANGACEVFWLLAHALRPRRAACVHPSFTEPEAALRAAGAGVATVLREPRAWTFRAADVPADAELVVVATPNNPTGALDDPDEILALRRPGRLVVVDESFMEFVADEHVSLASRRVTGVAVVRSLTKLWGLAGVRAGYLLAERSLIAALEAQRQPWSVNAPALAAMAACAAMDGSRLRVAGQVAAARAALLRALAELPGVEPWPAAANFVLVRVPGAKAVAGALRERGVAVRTVGDFAGLDADAALRIAVRPVPEQRVLLDALAEVLA